MPESNLPVPDPIDQMSAGQQFEMFLEALPDGAVTQDTLVQFVRKSEQLLDILARSEVLTKLLRGAYVSHAMRQAGTGSQRYGKGVLPGIIAELEERFGRRISDTVLYEERAVFDRINLNYRGDLTDLFALINEMERTGHRVYWKTIRNNFAEDIPPERLYGSEDNAVKVLTGRIEALGAEVERAASGSTATREELQGAAIAAAETLGALKHPDPEDNVDWTFYSKNYEDFIRSQPCFLSGVFNEVGRPHAVDVAHVWSGVMGAKESSLITVPLAHDLHRELHQIGTDSFARKYGYVLGEEEINWHRVVMNYMHLYMAGYLYDM